MAAATSGVDALAVKVTDRAQIVGDGVLEPPGLVIDEKLVSSGRIPAPAEVAQWLEAAA